MDVNLGLYLTIPLDTTDKEVVRREVEQFMRRMIRNQINIDHITDVAVCSMEKGTCHWGKVGV